jgi:hypothetical protein
MRRRGNRRRKLDVERGRGYALDDELHLFASPLQARWDAKSDKRYFGARTKSENRQAVVGAELSPLEAVAHDERITASYATRLVRLAFLAPDIVAAILAGKEPAGLTANN